MSYNLTPNNNYLELVLRKSFPIVTGHLLLTGNTTLKWTQFMTLGNVIVVYNPSTVYVCRHQSTGVAVAPPPWLRSKWLLTSDFERTWRPSWIYILMFVCSCLHISLACTVISLAGVLMVIPCCIYIGCCCIVHSTCTVQQHIIYTHTILYIVLLCITFNTTHWFQSANDYSTRKGSLVTVG